MLSFDICEIFNNTWFIELLRWLLRKTYFTDFCFTFVLLGFAMKMKFLEKYIFSISSCLVQSLCYSCSMKLFDNPSLNRCFLSPAWCYRSSHRRCSVKKGVVRNFAFSQENTCARVSFLIKLQALKNKKTLVQVFSYEFCEISKNTFFTGHLWTTASNVTRSILL